MVRLLVFLLFLNFSAASQTGKSWYKTLQGKIGKYPVTLHLHKAGNSYHGYYYYDSQQKPIYFTGNDTAYNGMIGLLAFASAEDNELFTFGINGTSVRGKWKKTAGSSPLSFTATASSAGFSYVYTGGSVKLKPSLENSPVGSYSAASIWPQNNTPGSLFLKQTIRNIFDEKYKGSEDIGVLLLKNKKQYLANYLEENKNVTEADIKEISFGYNNEADNQLMICFKSPSIASLAYFNYSFTGGAHGNHGISYTVIDLKKNKKLSLNEVIDAKERKKLDQLLEKYFRQQYNVKPNESLKDGGLFENKIEANNNFYLTGKGIGFCYNPYEIGPYAMGEINIFIPFSELPASRGLTNHPSSSPAR